MCGHQLVRVGRCAGVQNTELVFEREPVSTTRNLTPSCSDARGDVGYFP